MDSWAFIPEIRERVHSKLKCSQQLQVSCLQTGTKCPSTDEHECPSTAPPWRTAALKGATDKCTACINPTGTGRSGKGFRRPRLQDSFYRFSQNYKPPRASGEVEAGLIRARTGEKQKWWPERSHSDRCPATRCYRCQHHGSGINSGSRTSPHQ